MSPLELGLLQLRFVNYKDSFFPKYVTNFLKNTVEFLEVVKLTCIKEETWLKVKFNLKRKLHNN